jgi:peptidoglycan/xylan/chitin deacetylase (PgdA/CDA1 family)
MVSRQQIVASTLISMGLAKRARNSRTGQGCVLTFHGVRDDHGPSGVLDDELHTPVRLFRDLCRHLAENYKVLPLQDFVSALKRGRALPDRAVAITFDDGYESNYRLAFPILREFSLPAAIFLCTGYVDGTVRPWFHRVELAVARERVRELGIRIGGNFFCFTLCSSATRGAALGALLRTIKRLPQAEAADAVARIEEALQPAPGGIPAPLRAISWVQAREMLDSGLVAFGAHTHTHPILGRCAPEVVRDEIFTSRDRMTAELGAAPAVFAYPNGLLGDYDLTTMTLLRDAGFRAAFTMRPGFVRAGCNSFDLPRYGSPESLAQAEATVSGAFENFKEWRQKLRHAFAA